MWALCCICLGQGRTREKETGQILGPPQQWGTFRESRYCVRFIELLLDFINLKTTCFAPLTLSHSQMFLVSLCPHLVLALDFDLFAPSASLVFTLASLFLRNLSCPLSQRNLWQDQFQLASAASVTPQSFPWYSGSFILLFPFGRLRKAGHLDVRPWARHLPTLASGSTSVKRGGGVPDLLVLSQADVLQDSNLNCLYPQAIPPQLFPRNNFSIPGRLPMKWTENGVWNKLDQLGSQPALSYLFPTGMRIKGKMRGMPSFPLAKEPPPRRYFQRERDSDGWWSTKTSCRWHSAPCFPLESVKLSPSSPLYRQTVPVWFQPVPKTKTFPLTWF